MFTTTNLVGNNITNSQWSWIGQGQTCYRYTITNQPNSQVFFVLGDASVDPDGDGLSTAFETLVSKTNPSGWDTDGDGMPDWWEVWHGLLPKSNDASQDADGDGLTNLQEYLLGSDPKSSPTFEIFIAQPNSVSPLP
jgi:hypothetical protein